MPTKGQHLDQEHREALSKAMFEYWKNMNEKEKKERLKNFVDARRKPELADLPPQLEDPQRIFYWLSKTI